MPSEYDLAHRLGMVMDNQRLRHRYSMLAGRLLDDNTVTLNGADPGKCYVRNTPTSREQTQVWGTCNTINAPLEIDRRRDGSYEIVGIDWQKAVAAMGDAARSILYTRGGEDAHAVSIDGLGFKPGRLEPSQLGGLFVHVSDFNYAGGHWYGNVWDGNAYDQTTNDLDLTADVPASANTAGWVAVYLLPSDGLLHTVDGSTITVGASNDVSQLILDPGAASAYLIAIPAGGIPLGAVALYNGQTEISSDTPFLDLRRFDTDGSSSTALHSDYAAELSALTEKTQPVGADLVLIENSAASFVKAKVQVKNLPGAVYNASNVSNPPTASELTSAFGSPSALPLGFVGLVNDNGGGTTEYICWHDGTNWFYVSGAVKAL